MPDQSQQDRRFGDDIIAKETARLERVQRERERERVDPFFGASMLSHSRDHTTNPFASLSMDDSERTKEIRHQNRRMLEVAFLLLTGTPLPPSQSRSED